MTGTHRIIVADVLDGLAQLPDASVQCCVTSPPYWGLRDYGTATWEGGEDKCPHKPDVQPRSERNRNGLTGGLDYLKSQEPVFVGVCGKCGARRIDRQLGLEPTPEAYIERMVAVFREVRRVLRDDGTCWVNLGDSYTGGAGNSNGLYASTLGGSKTYGRGCLGGKPLSGFDTNVKPKDLVGIPWMFAFAARADGWYLRQDIIWHKPNPMPESVEDRCTKAHEYIFLLSKRERYYYDHEAAKEEASGLTGGACFGKQGQDANGTMAQQRRYDRPDYATRNRRSVWTVASVPEPRAHFATFPPKLIEPCIKAGTSERGCCPTCGAGWVRVVERTSTGKRYATGKSEAKNSVGLVTAFSGYGNGESCPAFRTLGWSPACTCSPAEPVPCTVLDPFSGSGTTGVVACGLGRNYIGIELNPEYAAMSEDKIGRALRPGTYRAEENGEAPLWGASA